MDQIIQSITSTNNSLIKEFVRLRDRKGELADTHFLVEGRRELERAVKCGFELETLLAEDDDNQDDVAGIKIQLRPTRSILRVSTQVFAKLALREDKDGVIGIFRSKKHNLGEILEIKSDRTLFVVLENIENPGNLGAILRTVDGLGSVAGVILLGKPVDRYNPNCIRTSLGGVFKVPVYTMTNGEFEHWTKTKKISTYAAVLSDKATALRDAQFKTPMALIMGNEANGLSAELLETVNYHVMIPMHGICDSLNVSVATAIFIYEAVNQIKP
jgi:RNA methyltransferase, TrmH family